MKQNQKWLSMLFAFLLLISSVLSPVAAFADSTIETNVKEQTEKVNEDNDGEDSDNSKADEDNTGSDSESSEENDIKDEDSEQDKGTSVDDVSKEKNEDAKDSQTNESNEKGKVEREKVDETESIDNKDDDSLSDTEEDTKDSIDRSDNLKDNVTDSIDEAKKYYKNNPPSYDNGQKGSHSDFWVYSALWGSGYKDLKNDFPWSSNEVSPWADHTYWSQGIEDKTEDSNKDAGIIIGSILLGENPYEFGKRNIVDDLIDMQTESGMFSTIWGEAWVLIALELTDAEYDKEKHIQAILSQQGNDGSFGFGDVDATGWTLTALAPYANTNEEVKQAIDKSVAWLHELFLENEEFPGMFGPNSNSTASVVMGLAAVGENLYGEKWKKDDTSLVIDLLEYQQENGSFWHKKDSAGAVGMATEQSLLAIATVVHGQSIFEKIKADMDIPSPPTEPASSELSKLIIDQGIGEVDLNDSPPYRYYLDSNVDKITLTPTVENENATIKVTGLDGVVNGKPNEIELKEGSNLKVITTFDEEGKQHSRVTFNFYKAFNYSPTKVTEYLPAPGQYVNQKGWGSNANEIIYGQSGVSLGSFGGYVVFEFDDLIKNDPNNPFGVDLVIYGNGFKGNEEPGGVQVMSANDDTWYDIAGSEHFEDETTVDYEVTYTNPDNTFSKGALDIPWQDNQGEEGLVKSNSFHKQSYFPNPDNYNTETLKYSKEALTFSGVKLENKAPAFGYVDVFPNGSNDGQTTNPYENNQAGAPIDIDWAVDKNGQPANVDDIKYVKVYTSMLKDAGAFGEVSTEVTKVARTNPESNIERTEDLDQITIKTSSNDLIIDIDSDDNVYNLNADAETIKVVANGDADNLYINNEKIETGKESKSISLNTDKEKTIRVIAQSEDNNPKIYYLNVSQGEELEVEVEKTELENQIIKAEKEETKNKTANSVKDFKAALDNATKVFNNTESTQKEVDEALETLKNAITNLQEIVVDKTDLEQEILKADKVDLENKTEDSVKDFDAALDNAIKVYDNTQSTQKEVDKVLNVLKKAMSNLKERAPPVTVDVRVETNEETLVPTTKIDVDLYDLKEYIYQDNNGESVIKDSPRAVHAIIQALETVDGLDVKDDKQFVLTSSGNYIEQVGNLAAFSKGPKSGWMYFVNNEFSPVGMLDYKLQENDSIVLYYVENYEDSTFTWFDSETYSIKAGDTLEVELLGNNSVKDTKVLVNEKEYTVDNENIVLKEDGLAELIFDEAGTYYLSANRFNEDNERNIVRPYAVVKVTEEGEEENDDLDTVAPVITVNGIKNGQKVLKNSITFSVQANDKIDGLVEPEVTLNKNKIKPNKNGKYNIELIEGNNVITVKATDKAGNTATKEYIVNYAPPLVEYDLDKVVNDTVDYIFNKGITSEWEAIGIIKAGKKVPASYVDTFNKAIDKEITNGLKNGQFKITDAERLTLAGLALGKDPQNIKGHNLIELIYNSPNRTLWDDTVVDTMLYQGNNGLAYALIALDSKDFEPPKDAKWSRQAIVDKLLETQLEDGSWSLNEEDYSTTSIDVTSMVLTALAPYKDQSEVKEALDKTVNYLSQAQTDQGGFDGGADVGGVTSEATAQTIIGLTAYGVDPRSKPFTEDGNNLIDHLLSYQNKDGGFSHTHDYQDSNEMATEQALLAIVAYELFLNDDEGIYQFSKGNTDTPIIENENENKDENENENPNNVPSKDNGTNDNESSTTNGKKYEEDDHLEDSSLLKDSDKLPKTATNLFNFIFIGMALIILGVVVIWVRKDSKLRDI